MPATAQHFTFAIRTRAPGCNKHLHAIHAVLTSHGCAPVLGYVYAGGRTVGGYWIARDVPDAAVAEIEALPIPARTRLRRT